MNILNTLLNMKYELHYAKLELDGDIPCLTFNNPSARISKIQDIVIGSKGKVFILCIDWSGNDTQSDVYVFENYQCISFLSDGKLNRYKKMYLQEYISYEEAYAVALNMREDSDLYYNPNIKLN
jgi:hypothetical protein